MVARSPKRAVETADHLGSLSKLAFTAYEDMEREFKATIDDLKAKAQLFETAIDNISQGICFFDANERLILHNRRYAEIYRLAPDKLQPGKTLADVIELRLAAGTSPIAGDAYLAFARSVNSSNDSTTWTAELKDGHTIQVMHRPMPGGGWIATHEDITELAASA